MNCLQTEEYFSAHFEDTLDYQTLQAFEAHLTACKGCRHEYVLFQESVKAAQQLPQIDASPYFMPALQQRLAEEQPEELSFWRQLIQVVNRPRWQFSGIMLLIFAAASIYFYQEGTFDRNTRPTTIRNTQTSQQTEQIARPLRTQLPPVPTLNNRQFLPRSLGTTSVWPSRASQPMQQHYLLKTVSYANSSTRGGL